MRIEICWNDLTEKKQKEILELLGKNGNWWDVFPIVVTFEIEEEE